MTQTPPPGAEPSRREALEQAVESAIDLVKPKLRGWLHAGMTPVALVSGIILIVLAGTTREKVSAAVFAGTAVLLFGTSAVYHRGTWSPRVGGFLRRFDHSNIFLIIAGTYTPFAVILLWDDGGEALLWIVWSAAIAGIAFRILWVGAPRWLYTPIYLALGWVSVFYIGDIYRTGGAAVVALLAVGGGLYSVGAVVYAIKRPNPSPRWFGFHEVFHALTLLAFIVHYIAVSLVTYQH